MELNEIKKQGKWTDISDTLNENFIKIDAQVTKIERFTNKNKGYFRTAEALVEAYPTATKGDIAYIGKTHPYAIYAWDSNWYDTGESGGDVNVNLEDLENELYNNILTLDIDPVTGDIIATTGTDSVYRDISVDPITGEIIVNAEY